LTPNSPLVGKAIPIVICGLLICLANATPGYAAPRSHVLAVGHNGAPELGRETSELKRLKFADDDAAAFFTFSRAASASGNILTMFDADTARRFPELATLARPPSLAELRRAVAELKAAVAEDRRAGRESIVFIFFSGHGVRTDAGAAFLLLDGEITSEVLYHEILDPIDATYLHLVVDACHAEDIVRPRDAKAQLADTTPEHIAEHLGRTTLARFPRVGTLIATTSTAEAHEWDAYQGGVFTHLLLSALRGGADVNGDGRVEYSEVAAFVAAANREVLDSRARLRAILRPPSLNPRVTLVNTRELVGSARLRGYPHYLRTFRVEDDRGNHLVELRAEHDHNVTLVLPAERRLFVRSTGREAELRARAGSVVPLSDLVFLEDTTAKRGSVNTALREGLFATPFGPSYYRGFVDRSDLASVEFRVEETGRPVDATAPSTNWRQRARWLAMGSSAALAVTGGVFGSMGVADYMTFRRTEIQREATEARRRVYERGTVALLLISSSAMGALAAVLLGRYDTRQP
jgi:hypothetical protein